MVNRSDLQPAAVHLRAELTWRALAAFYQIRSGATELMPRSLSRTGHQYKKCTEIISLWEFHHILPRM